MSIRQKNKKVYTAKWKLLQSLTIGELSDLYDKYCYVKPTELKQGENFTGMDLVKMATQPSQPNTRQKYIEKIIQEMSWESLKIWAKEHKVKYENLT